MAKVGTFNTIDAHVTDEASGESSNGAIIMTITREIVKPVIIAEGSGYSVGNIIDGLLYDAAVDGEIVSDLRFELSREAWRAYADAAAARDQRSY